MEIATRSEYHEFKSCGEAPGSATHIGRAAALGQLAHGYSTTITDKINVTCEQVAEVGPSCQAINIQEVG